MDSKSGGRSTIDLWSEIMEEESPMGHQPKVQLIYRRRRQQDQAQDLSLNPSHMDKENRVCFADVPKRVSWKRSLSTRGRISIAAASACMDIRKPQQKQVKRRAKFPVPIPPNFEMEREYFHEVDAFELVEESPSPKNFVTGEKCFHIDALPHLSSRLERWLMSKKLNPTDGASRTLSKVLETPAVSSAPFCEEDSNSLTVKTPEKNSRKVNPDFHSVRNRINTYLLSKDPLGRDFSSKKSGSVSATSCSMDIEAAVKKLSLSSTPPPMFHKYADPFVALLALCSQEVPLGLMEVFTRYCVCESIIKIGEGTYGEAFKAGNAVCKIVPIDGDVRVNGEPQKRSEELLEEVVLSQTLNHLKGVDTAACNSCSTFIETLELRVCRGQYDNVLLNAWEDWDEKHDSENEHPKKFAENQCYVVFVLQHGGKDLESFVLLNFDEARSLLVQVTAALAVAEAAYEFEHRDLHWGNILLSRDDHSITAEFTLEEKHMAFHSYGLSVSIIDFSLSRINTGEDILFLDLSSDPYLFRGPKGDKQAETYRKMKSITEDYWEGSFPKTNVLWLLYLVDLLLLKKSYESSSNNKRDLRSLKKRLDGYNSAKEAIFDPFFMDMLVI